MNYPIYVVLSIGFSCPGGWFSGLVPKAARPLLCQQVPQEERFDRLDRARKRVVELGPGAVLEECRGLRCKKLPVKWVTTPEFEED